MEISREQFAVLKKWQRKAYLRMSDWLARCRPSQIPPAGIYRNWMFMAGRGSGKTRTMAEQTFEKGITNEGWFIGVIAPTHNDLKQTCFEGESGLLSVIPYECIQGGIDKGYNRSEVTLKLINGSKITGFSAERPSRLRGPQFHFAWCDELAAWNDGKKTEEDSVDKAAETWAMLDFCLRLGESPQCYISTTPRPLPLVKKILNDPQTVITTDTTFANRENLSAAFFDSLEKYEGTRLGRQELYAEMLEDEEGAIFHRNWFKLWPSDKALPRFEYIIQSYDTAFTEKVTNDPTACTTWGIYTDPEKSIFAAMLLDCWQDHLAYPDLKPKIIDEYYDCVYGENEKQADIVLIENKGSGISLVQDLRRHGVPVMPYNPGRADKVQRAHVVSYLPANGLISLPESSELRGYPRKWCTPFIDELVIFNALMNTPDHYTDSAVQAWQLLADQSFLRVQSKQEKEEERQQLEEDMLATSSVGNPYAT